MNIMSRGTSYSLALNNVEVHTLLKSTLHLGYTGLLSDKYGAIYSFSDEQKRDRCWDFTQTYNTGVR